MLFFIIVFIVYTFINVYIFRKTFRFLPTVRGLRMVFCVGYLIVYFAFLIAMLGRNDLALPLQKVLYRIGVVWMGAMLYLTLWFVLNDLVSFVFRRWRRFATWQVLAGYLLTVVVLTAGYYRFTHPVAQSYNINMEDARRDLKMVVVSDLHLGVSIDKKRLQQYVALINAQQPDLILIAGDVVDNNALPIEVEKMYEELNCLHAPLGVYMCLGNHEYLSGIESSLAFLQKTNITLLRDSLAVIPEVCRIVGRDDLQGNPHRKSLADLLASSDTSLPAIVIDHEPVHLEEAADAGVALQVSGHTHRGQLFPMNLLVKSMFEDSYGYLQKNNTHFIVTSGLGLWGPPFRIGTQSEFVVINVR